MSRPWFAPYADEAMQAGLLDWYLWLKAGHVISVIAWMAGLLYLPRLFVYHAERGRPGSELSATLIVMEYRLLRYIMTPAMISVWFFGVLMLMAGAIDWSQGWPWGKAVLVLAMTAFHGLLASWRRDLEAGRSRRSARDFRIANEIPTVIMILIVILVITKPF